MPGDKPETVLVVGDEPTPMERIVRTTPVTLEDMKGHRRDMLDLPFRPTTVSLDPDLLAMVRPHLGVLEGSPYSDRVIDMTGPQTPEDLQQAVREVLDLWREQRRPFELPPDPGTWDNRVIDMSVPTETENRAQRRKRERRERQQRKRARRRKRERR